jgi:hypothetical protein
LLAQAFYIVFHRKRTFFWIAIFAVGDVVVQGKKFAAGEIYFRYRFGSLPP